MIRIAILGYDYLANNGIANASRAFAEALASYGYNVHMISFKSFRTNAPRYTQTNGVNIHRLKLIGKINKLIYKALPNLYFRLIPLYFIAVLRKIKPHFIIGPLIYYWGNVAANCKKYIKTKSITIGHGEDVNQLDNDVVKQQLTILSLHKNDIIITTNSDFQETLSKFTSKKIYLLPNPLPEAHIRIDFTKKLQNSPFRIICVGRLATDNQGYEIKGFTIAIEAMALLNNCHLDIIGDGPLYANYMEMIVRKNLVNSITLHKQRSRLDVLRIMSCANVLVIPSNIEGLSMVMIEGLQCALPVIATNIGGAKDYIVSGYNGFLIKKGDFQDLAAKIKILQNDRSLLAEMSQNAKKTYLEYFTPERVVRRFEDIIKETCLCEKR